jgi:hypothetical protein
MAAHVIEHVTYNTSSDDPTRRRTRVFITGTCHVKTLSRDVWRRDRMERQAGQNAYIVANASNYAGLVLRHAEQKVESICRFPRRAANQCR